MLSLWSISIGPHEHFKCLNRITPRISLTFGFNITSDKNRHYRYMHNAYLSCPEQAAQCLNEVLVSRVQSDPAVQFCLQRTAQSTAHNQQTKQTSDNLLDSQTLHRQPPHSLAFGRFSSTLTKFSVVQHGAICS